MSARGPTALKGSKGPKRIYAQGFTEQARVYGAEDEIGSHRIDIKSKATLQNCGSYIGNGGG